MLKYFFLSIIHRNVKHIVWHDKAIYNVAWVEENHCDVGEFNYYIYCYPYRLNNKYKLECATKHIRFLINPRRNRYQMEIHNTAIKKVLSFERGELE